MTKNHNLHRLTELIEMLPINMLNGGYQKQINDYQAQAVLSNFILVVSGYPIKAQANFAMRCNIRAQAVSRRI